MQAGLVPQKEVLNAKGQALKANLKVDQDTQLLKLWQNPLAKARVKSEPIGVKIEPERRPRSRSRGTGVKIEPKDEDTSRPRGRPPTKVKLEDGTETSSKRRGRPAGSKNKPK